MLTLVYSSKNRDKEKEASWIQSCGSNDIEVLHVFSNTFAKSYQTSLDKAAYDVVVFIREDVVFGTKGWGKTIVSAFETTNFGMLGIVGSIAVPMSGLVWEKEESLVGRIWYQSFHKDKENRFSEVFPKEIIPAIALDDAFFAVSPKRLKEGFDEQFVSDSFYDLDFFLTNYQKGVRIGVLFEVKVMKQTMNPQDKAWRENRKRFIQKHTDLPVRLKPKLFFSQSFVKVAKTPKVSMLIACKGNPIDVASCLSSIYEQTTYPHLEIVVIDLGSSKKELEAIRGVLKNYQHISFVQKNYEHLPSIYEEVVHLLSPDTELILFCNPRIILLNDAISLLVEAYLKDRKHCGTLGIRMHTESNRVRHVGLQLLSAQVGEDFELGLSYLGFQTAYKYRNEVLKNVLGSSKDFLMIGAKLYRELEGFNKSYLYSLEDFELNLKAILWGKKNRLVGTAVCYHLGRQMPKFLPIDFERLTQFVNKHIETCLPYIDFLAS